LLRSLTASLGLTFKTIIDNEEYTLSVLPSSDLTIAGLKVELATHWGKSRDDLDSVINSGAFLPWDAVMNEKNEELSATLGCSQEHVENEPAKEDVVMEELQHDMEDYSSNNIPWREIVGHNYP
jgi:hypothetical protein